jgi:RNA polymerase sigma factor (sigma-70 family)
VRTYLYGIAFKLLSAERRKLGRDQPADLIAISSHDSDERLWVRQALDRLEANDREILMLREYEQLSYGKIAALLRLPLNTVRTRPFRARMELKGGSRTRATPNSA